MINKVAPNSLAALYLGGRVALAQGKAGEAVTLLQKAVQGAPGFAAARLLLAVAQLQQGNVAVAESELQTVLQASPDNVAARKLLAQAQIRQGRGSDAAAVLAPALASDTSDPAVYTLAGQASMMEGERSEGEAYLERGLAAAPDDPKARLDLAASYLAAGDPKRALEILATVPDDVGGDTKNQIQFIALASGKDKAVARMEIEALVKRNAGDVKLLNLAAGWFAYQGDVETARKYLEQALAVAPKDPTHAREPRPSRVPGEEYAGRDKGVRGGDRCRSEAGRRIHGARDDGRAVGRRGAGGKVDRGLAQGRSRGTATATDAGPSRVREERPDRRTQAHRRGDQGRAEQCKGRGRGRAGAARGRPLR